MTDEIHLISDGDGLAVIGEPKAVDRFLTAEGLESQSLDLQRLVPSLAKGAAATHAAATVASASGRWVQLTAKSAQNVRKFGLRESAGSGLSTGVVKGNAGQIRGFVEFVGGPGTLANPALLSGAAGLMTQLAMQQAMDDITDYLATIDKKVEDVLRAQTDSVLADMLGVGLVIEEAMSVRDHVGRVSEVTWSKVQVTSFTIARTQGYALRALQGLTEKIEGAGRIGELADQTKEAEAKVQEWLAVLARCFQLQEAIGVLELDRVLDAAPHELESHRIAVQTARQGRLALFASHTDELLTRIDAATERANARVLLNPGQAPAVVRSSNRVATHVGDFRLRLGIDAEDQSWEARRWRDAAAEVRDRALEVGSEGVGTARGLGSDGIERAKSASAKLSSGVSRLARRRREGDQQQRETPEEVEHTEGGAREGDSLMR